MNPRIASGIAFLDQVVPGWRDRITLEKLNLSEPYSCVVGQVSDSNYVGFMTQYGLHNEDMVAMGFESASCVAGANHNLGPTKLEYAALTREWKEVLSPVGCTSAVR